MSSDERTSGAGGKNDITADELLVLLNKSMERDSSYGDSSRNMSKKTDGNTSAGTLEIDDSVYRVAEDKLHNSEALTLTDDSDLDVDALIEKFINKHKDEEAAYSESEASEGTPLENVAEEDFVEIAVEEGASQEISEEVAPEEAVTQDYDENAENVQEFALMEAVPEEYADDEAITAQNDYVSEDTASAEEAIDLNLIKEMLEEMNDGDSSEADLSAEDEAVSFSASPETVFAAEAEIDASVVTASGDDTAASECSEEIEDTRKTEVFDISLVKKLANEEQPAVDEAKEEAFTASETEVFTPVSDVTDEIIEDSASEEAVVYGEYSEDEIDQTDLNLMLAFGMDEELRETVGEEKAVEIEDDIIKKHEETAQMQAVADSVEFTSRDQIGDILNTYKTKYYTLIIRIAAALALLVGIFLVENSSLLGLTLPAFMRPASYPMVYAMIDLQLVILCGALSFRQIINGVKSIIALKPSLESLTAFAVAMSVIYTFVAAFAAPVEGFRLYNLPVALTVLFSLVYEFLNVRREVLSFNVVASNKKKFVVTPVSDATESLEREIFRDYISEDSKIIRVGKADFVDGFFARCEQNSAFKPIIGIMIPAVVIMSLLFMILAFIRTGSVYQAFTHGFITASVTLPLTSFVVYSYPFYKASKDAFNSGSAIVGEASLAEYSDSSVISFEDKEVFPSDGVRVTSIKVYGNNRIDEIIYSLASAFIKVGGPLADVFNKATYDLGHSEDVELIEVDDDGFTVTVDDIQVYIGKASYMEKKDYDPPFDSEGRRLEQSGNIGVLYVAYGGQLAAKVYVQYTIDTEFENILAQLYKTGLCVGIKSFDPNIDDLLLAKKIKAMKYPAKVIRAKTVEDIPHTVERCDSGIVSGRSVKALLRTVAACERVSRVVKTGLIVKLLAMLIGVVVMIFISAFGDRATISSLYLALYQIFWAVPIFLISKFLV